jgi:hypothetical protein
MPILAKIGTIMITPIVESCIQVDVRYYLQCLTTDQKWRNYPRFPRGFKSEKSAVKLLKKVKITDVALTEYRVINCS